VLLAFELEREMPKDRILELYLNYIEWGDGIYGCEAASQAYFGCSAADLDPQEAIELASVVFRPLRYTPGESDGPLRGYQHAIARYMWESNYLSDEEYASLWKGR
jgi:monofunctional biosynthetic peptidoglycan transglycosylase